MVLPCYPPRTCDSWVGNLVMAKSSAHASPDAYDKAQAFADRVDRQLNQNQQAHDKALNRYRDIQNARFSLSPRGVSGSAKNS